MYLTQYELLQYIRHSCIEGDWLTSLEFMGIVHIIHWFIQLTRSLRFIGGYRFYQFTALPFSIATVFLEFTKVAKELKLMALAEGISIRQYIDGWLMTTNSKPQCQGYTHWGCILSRAWVGSQISKIRFISNSINRSYGYNSTSG